jgi:hypothetical protein
MQRSAFPHGHTSSGSQFVSSSLRQSHPSCEQTRRHIRKCPYSVISRDTTHMLYYNPTPRPVRIFKSTTIAEFNPSGQIRYYNPSLIPSLLAMQSSFPSVPGSGATQVPPFHTDAPQNGVSLNTSAINSLAINDAPKDSDELLSHPYFIETV